MYKTLTSDDRIDLEDLLVSAHPSLAGQIFTLHIYRSNLLETKKGTSRLGVPC